MVFLEDAVDCDVGDVFSWFAADVGYVGCDCDGFEYFGFCGVYGEVC